MSTKLIVFLEILGLIGAVAFFSGQHSEHLDRLKTQLDTIQRSVNATEAALQSFRATQEAITSARIETDKKLMEAGCYDGNLRYEYYDRLLREDAERRACPPPSAGSSGSLP